MRTVAIYLSALKETGGTFQYARTLAHALAESLRPDIRVVALCPTGTEWESICAGMGVECRTVEGPSPAQRVAGKVLRTLGARGTTGRNLMSRFTPLGRALDALDAELCIYTQYEHFSYELATPSLIPIHDLMHRYESRFAENRAYVDPDRFFSLICNGARGILVDSRVGREQLIESYGPFDAAVHVLPYIPPDNVLDTSLLEPDPRLDEVLASLPEKFLFYPAQFWEHKNHIRLIDAVMAAAERYPDIHLVLAGSPKNHYESVLRHIRESGAGDRVTLLGYISDHAKVEVYRRARALVMPTFYGPTNIPPLEAFVLGCPVATSRIYGVPEQLGDAALLFDPESTDEMRTCIERLWDDDDLVADLVARGAEHARTWGRAQFAARLWEIVEASIDGGPAR